MLSLWLIRQPLGKTLLGNKTPGIDPSMIFYELEGGDNTEEGEESETLVIHNLSIALYKQNFVKRKFPCINTFNHEGLKKSVSIT